MCNCITQTNEALVKHNTRLNVPVVLGKSFDLSASTRVVIATEKIESRKRTGPVKIFASFCPFCGDGYGSEEI